MLIWLLAILLFAMFGALGYAKGAIRMLFPLVGLFVAALLALPLSPLVRPLIPKVGLENPVWSILLPPVVIFLLISIVFLVVGFFGHAKIHLFYKYRTDDSQRLQWERLNQRLGVPVGLLAGAIYLVLIGIVVQVLGYLTVQVSQGENETGPVKYLNQARSGMQASGLDKMASAFDPAPASYYEAADVLGLLYHNPPLHTRLASYPALLSLAELPELQAVATDPEFQNMLAGQPSLQQVIDDPKTQAILGNPDLLERLRSIDLQDLNEYLRTGTSEKFIDTPILGRWELDSYQTFLQEKRRRRNMTATDVRLLRFEMEFMKGLKVYISPDNKVRLKGPDISQMIGRLVEMTRAIAEGSKPRPQVQYVVPQAQPDPNANENALARDRMRQRYGVGGGQQQQPQAPQQVLIPTPSAAPAVPSAPPMSTTELAAELAKLPLVTLAEGTWEEEDGKYVVKFSSQNNIPQFVGTQSASTVELSVRDGKLFLADAGKAMVMAKF